MTSALSSLGIESPDIVMRPLCGPSLETGQYVVEEKSQ